jgi:hypothetical protein
LRLPSSNISQVIAMKISFVALAMAGVLALAIEAVPTFAPAADFFGIPIPGTAPPLPPPLDLSAPTGSAPPPPSAPAPDALAGAYVPMPPPGMVTYPGYTAAYPNTGCRGAYWARKPIFNADGLLIGYTRPQYMCPQWY